MTARLDRLISVSKCQPLVLRRLFVWSNYWNGYLHSWRARWLSPLATPTLRGTQSNFSHGSATLFLLSHPPAFASGGRNFAIIPLEHHGTLHIEFIDFTNPNVDVLRKTLCQFPEALKRRDPEISGADLKTAKAAAQA